MEIELYNDNNISIINKLLVDNRQFCAIYGDPIYEETDFTWTNLCYDLLEKNGVFYLQTDDSTITEYLNHLDYLFGKFNRINIISVKFEWGGRSKRCFPKKTDRILFYAKSKNYKFYYERILVPKKTAGTKLDKRGDGLKIPCDCWDDMSFSTLAKERVKLEEHNIRWQKPLKMMDRLLLPITDENDWILDPFLGSGTTGEWCAKNNRNFTGIEIKPEIYSIAKERIEKN